MIKVFESLGEPANLLDDQVDRFGAAVADAVCVEVGQDYAIAFGMSAAAVFFNPAASSVLPALVDDEQLVRANSGIWTAAVVSQIALAPLAGLLVARAGFTPPFLINAARFAVSAVVLTGLRLPQPPRPTSRGACSSTPARA
jgi:MFS family permease